MTDTARYTLPVEVGAPRERLTARLWAAGAIGVWEQVDAVVAWFEDRQADVPPGGRWEDEPARDWQSEWKAGIAPVHAGRTVVVPSWLVDDYVAGDLAGHVPQPDEIRIVLDPGGAFGSGHHATTTLCLQMLQDAVTGGAAVLDVGTGTGVLAIAAALLGAGAVCGVDVRSGRRGRGRGERPGQPRGR